VIAAKAIALAAYDLLNDLEKMEQIQEKLKKLKEKDGK